MGIVIHKRFRIEDRRQNIGIINDPFKDCSGATIRICRRATPDRRLANIHAEWIDER
jgi:hypothetical protein